MCLEILHEHITCGDAQILIEYNNDKVSKDRGINKK